MQLTAYGSWLLLEVWLLVLHFPNVRQSTARIYSVMRWGTGRFDIKSFRYKFTQGRSKKFHLLGLKNEEHSPKMFFLFTRNFTWSEGNFRAISLLEFTSKRLDSKRLWIETTVFHEMTLLTILFFCNEKRKNSSESSIQTSPVFFILFHCLHKPLKLASLMATCHKVYTSLPDPYNLKETGWEQLKQKKNV